MTFEVILYFMKNLCLHNVSIHTNFYQNRFINEYDRKKKAKISESRSLGVTESRNHGVTEFFSEIYIEELTFLKIINQSQLRTDLNKKKTDNRGLRSMFLFSPKIRISLAFQRQTSLQCTYILENFFSKKAIKKQYLRLEIRVVCKEFLSFKWSFLKQIR